MKLANLFESQVGLDFTPEKVAKTIEDHCKDILAAYEKADIAFIRGEASLSSPFISSSIRTDRTPRAFTLSQHKALEKAFEKLNLPVNRSNGLFCSTSGSTASSWGTKYIIFPYDGWEGLIFEHVHGYAWDEFSDFMRDNKISSYRDASEEEIDKLAEFVKRLGPVLFNVTNAVDILHREPVDVLIRGRGYLGIRDMLVGDQKADFAPSLEVLKLLGLKHLKNVRLNSR